eukprot:5190286-Amphidinium_carterae.1
MAEHMWQQEQHKSAISHAHAVLQLNCGLMRLGKNLPAWMKAWENKEAEEPSESYQRSQVGRVNTHAAQTGHKCCIIPTLPDLKMLHVVAGARTLLQSQCSSIASQVSTIAENASFEA